MGSLSVVRPVRKLSVEPFICSSNERIMVIRTVEMDKFFGILSDQKIKLLLDADKCNVMIDNYLMATVLVYFKRAGFSLAEYTPDNFWKCLYLAHDQEEDEEELKWEMLAWALGESWQLATPSFLVGKDEIWRRMGHRSVVSVRQCEQIMRIPGHANHWTRTRQRSHAGAVRKLGEEESYTPKGPHNMTPSFSALCSRCKDQDTTEDEFVITDSLDTEELDEENDDTMEETDNDDDSDSGLETSDSDNEDYRNIAIFARE